MSKYCAFTYKHRKELTLSAKAKSLLLATILCFPCAWLATAIGDNPSVADSFKYVFSPGAMLATHLAIHPTHSWSEMFEELSHWLTIALVTNMVFYGMLIFGVTSILFAMKRSG